MFILPPSAAENDSEKGVTNREGKIGEWRVLSLAAFKLKRP